MNIKTKCLALFVKLKQKMNSGTKPIDTTSSHTCTKPTVSGSCEALSDKMHGDLVPLVWEIEKLRRKEGGCTMNELIAEVKKNFKGLENVKHRSVNYR